jgi:hypothetical protein
MVAKKASARHQDMGAVSTADLAICFMFAFSGLKLR